MKQFLIETLVKKLLSWFGNVNADQWEKAKTLVKDAATKLAHLPGEQRRQYVVDELKKAWGKLAPFVVNLMVDNAFGLLKDSLKK
jgi:hypothetical protein